VIWPAALLPAPSYGVYPKCPFLADHIDGDRAGTGVGIGPGGILSMNIRHVCTYVCYEIDDHLLRLD
jgi:hypothetical protein